MKIFALILFVVTYALMIALQKARPWIALGSAAVFIIAGIVPFSDILPSIDFNVLLMLIGTMGTVSLFIASGMPGRLAEILLEKSPNIMWVAVAMSLFAGIVSAFIDNVATVLMIAHHLYRGKLKSSRCRHIGRRHDQRHAGRLRRHGFSGFYLYGWASRNLLCCGAGSSRYRTRHYVFLPA